MVKIWNYPNNLPYNIQRKKYAKSYFRAVKVLRSAR